MKISYNWLKTFIDLDIPLEEMCEKLTMSGLEVEHVEHRQSIKGGLEGLVVGEVMETSKHPNADKLKLTKVNIGNDTILPIVCGAPNVEAKQKVVVAPVGTTIHPAEGDAFQIKKAKIRGEVSEGMLCAEDEIGLGKGHDGILVLDKGLKVGQPLTDLYEIENDVEIEIAIIPNRGDAISHLGVARELQALTGIKYKKPNLKGFDARGQHRVDIEIKNSFECPRYAGISLIDVTVEASPEWLQNRLRSIGLNPINNVVDITNFVQHELGQPLHAFDLSKIDSRRLDVRLAHENETLTTLDGEERKLHAEDVVIADSVKALALGGVLGGLDSGVHDTTTSVFLESAYFNPTTIRKTAKRFGLNTDASYRFERGTDPEMVIYALKRAVDLLIEITGCEAASEIVDIYPDFIPPTPINLNLIKLNEFMGVEVPKEEVLSILQNLEIKITANNGENLMLAVPKYRPDVTRAVDIYEEVIRIYGFDNIPLNRKVNYSPSIISDFSPNKIQSKISNYLSGIGLNEILSNSLTSAKYYTQNQVDKAVTMLNPLSQDMAIMRMELLHSALQNIAYNLNRKNNRLQYYEFGKTYEKNGNDFIEKQVLQITVTGNRFAEHWSSSKQPISLEHVEDIGFKILEKLNIPAKQLVLISDVKEVEADLLKQHGIKQKCYTLELDWDKCLNLASQKIVLKDIPKFPVVRRDLSLVLAKDIEYKAIEKIAKQSLQPYLENTLLFDVYEGKPLKADQKSLSVAFFLYNPKKTMEDAEIDGLMSKLITTFENQIGAVIRK